MQMASMATLLEARRVPVLYVYSEEDQLVDLSASAEYAELFGITAHLTKRYTENGQQTNADDVNSGEKLYSKYHSFFLIQLSMFNY